MTPYELALVLASALLHALWSASIKQSGDPLCFNLLQLPLAFVGLALALPFFSLSELPPALGWLLPLTALTHAFYSYWMCRAFEHGDLSLVYPIARSTPAFLPFVAVPLLGERLTAGGALGIAVVVIGVGLVHGISRWHLRDLMQPAARFAFLTLATTVGYSLIDKAAMAALARAPWHSALPVALVYYLLLSSAYGLVFAPLVLRRRGFAAVRAASTPSMLARRHALVAGGTARLHADPAGAGDGERLVRGGGAPDQRDLRPGDRQPVAARAAGPRAHRRRAGDGGGCRPDCAVPLISARLRLAARGSAGATPIGSDDEGLRRLRRPARLAPRFRISGG